ncbi:MAG: AraC family transcriptional regulator [Lachnospiraceae bacterium]|nr:AraC family transcriptional regulator [Lachnospiraceae bacterium]
MINVSGHLRNRRRAIGYEDTENPIVVNCCGWQVFKTKDYSQQRTDGRLDYQIIYLYKGMGHYLLDGQWVNIPAGNILLFRPAEPQVYAYYADDNPEVYWIHFTGTACDEILRKYEIGNCYIGENLSVKILFQEIITELQLKKALYNDVVISSFYKMLALICRFGSQGTQIPEDHFSIDRLIMKLNQSYQEPWSIASMADYCKLSESYFSHTFKSYTGAAPMHFLNELRIERAKDLLFTNTMSVSVVSALVGFEDPLYFSRVFKKFTGVPPKQFLQDSLKQNTPKWWTES